MRWKHTLAVFVLSLVPLAGVPLAQDQPKSEREQQLEEAIQLIRNQLADKDRFITGLEQDKKDLNAKIVLLERIAEQKDIQMGLHQKNEAALQATIDDQRQQIEMLTAAISERDKAIQELVKGMKTSGWVKVAESIPSIAAIIATAIVSK